MVGLLTRGYDDLIGLSGFGRMFTDFERVVRDLDGVSASPSVLKLWTLNKENAYELAIDMPGVPEKEINLQAHNGVLTVSGVRKLETPEGYRVQRRERRGYEFSRSFSLPQDADSEQVSAVMKNGVLKIEVARRPEVQPRQIPVSVG